MRLLIFIFFSFLLLGCNPSTKRSEDIRLNFLDEYVLPNDLMVDSTMVGGLSGIDYHNEKYYIACDDSKNPRFYTASIETEGYKFNLVQIDSVIELEESDMYLDLESIVVDSISDAILMVSEGNIKNGDAPSFIKVDSIGKVIDNYEIPQYFKAKGKQKPRHNGVFEGLASSFDNSGYWTAIELPLKEDGPKPKFTETTSPVRFTFFDSTGKAMKQFAYLLDKIGKKPLKDFAVNGVTDLLAYASDKLLVIERSYSSGYGNQGNIIKLYSVDHSDFLNTLTIKRLKRDNYSPVKKELVFDFESVRDQLTNNSIDNVEGICFGPVLPNGNKSLILITDNDFNKQGNRQNQVILMEILD